MEVTTFGERWFRRGPATASASGLVQGRRDGRPVTLTTNVPGRRVAITRR